MLLCEYDIGMPGRAMELLLEAIAPDWVSKVSSPMYEVKKDLDELIKKKKASQRPRLLPYYSKYKIPKYAQEE